MVRDQDEALLDGIPDYMSVGVMLKATPSADGGHRYVYFEASNEDVDHQNEIILQKALEESSGYYLRHGNIDISHYTMIGPKLGLQDYLEYEIGKPVAVHVDGKRTFVKAELYQGESAMARRATTVWESLTKQKPAATWYASVGGSVLRKSIKLDPKTGNRIGVAEAVRWSNTAMDRCPVNKTVAAASAAPIGTFAKSLGGFIVAKALTAGYATDAAAMTGGQALSMQSLDGAGKQRPRNYFDLRERLADDIRRGKVSQVNAHGLVEHCVNEHGLPYDEAAEQVERFMRDLKTELTRRSTRQ